MHDRDSTTAWVENCPEGYYKLASVLIDALEQAASGKGQERHGSGLPFSEQPMQDLIALYGPGFALGQAAKKAQESRRLPGPQRRDELLGAINYLAGLIVYEDRNGEAQ